MLLYYSCSYFSSLCVTVVRAQEIRIFLSFQIVLVADVDWTVKDEIQCQ